MLEFLKILAILVLVSYKPVSYKKKCSDTKIILRKIHLLCSLLMLYSCYKFCWFFSLCFQICFGQNVKALTYRWRQICSIKIKIFTLNAPISTNEVSKFKLAIEVFFKYCFDLIHAIFLSLICILFWDARYFEAISNVHS